MANTEKELAQSTTRITMALLHDAQNRDNGAEGTLIDLASFLAERLGTWVGNAETFCEDFHRYADTSPRRRVERI